MAREKQKKVLKEVSKGKSLRQATKDAGYSQSYADTGRIKESKTWKELVAKYLPEDKIAKRHEELLDSVFPSKVSFDMPITNKVIRAVVNPKVSVPKNPLMILRAIRFSLRYDFRIDSDLEEAMRKNRKELRDSLSPERLQIEVLKMLKEDYDGTLQLMRKFKLEDILTNEDYDIFEIIKDINIENFDGDISQLIEERTQ